MVVFDTNVKEDVLKRIVANTLLPPTEHLHFSYEVFNLNLTSRFRFVKMNGANIYRG